MIGFIRPLIRWYYPFILHIHKAPECYEMNYSDNKEKKP